MRHRVVEDENVERRDETRGEEKLMKWYALYGGRRKEEGGSHILQ
jgi:hypothetical protein